MKRFVQQSLSVSLALIAMGSPGTARAGATPPTQPAATSPGQTQSSTLYGVVRGTKNGQYLGDVPVVLHNKTTNLSLDEKTNSQGGYLFTNLPPGDYEILVGGGTYSRTRKEGFLKAGMTGEIDFSVRTLSKGSSILSGTVFQQQGETSSPISADIKAKNLENHEIYSFTSNQQGKYALSGIPSGTYLLEVTRDGFSPVSRTIDVSGNTRENITLHLNRLASANIRAEGSKKIKDNNGAISIIDQKKFQQNLSTGAAYTLMQNSPSIEFYSRSGSQGVSGGMNYMSCRGYTVGGANTNPQGTSGIEMSVEGVPMNIEADGGEIYDLGIMNTDIKSATVLRGVTTSRETGNYAAGCSINFHLVDPLQNAFQTVNSGGGSYGLYYTSYINNSGINQNTNIGGYNDFTILHQDGFQQFTPLTEYQYYGNLTKYLSNGKLYFLATANFKTYDRGASETVANFNTYGATNNGGPSFGNPGNTGDTPNSPFYKNWNYGRFMLDLGFKDQVTPSIRLKNSLYAEVEPQGDTSMPAGFSGTPGTGYNPISPNMSGQLGYQFLQNYYQAEGYKTGDIAEVRYNLFKNDLLYLGMKGQYATYHYMIDPLMSDNIVGGTNDAIYSQTSIVGYLEDHYQPVKQVLLNVGFRVASIAQYYNDQVSPSQTSSYQGVSNGGSELIPMPHVGVNVYPARHWKLYVTGGESFAPPAIFDFKGYNAGQTPGGVNPENVWDLSTGVRYSTDRGFLAADVFSDYLTNMPVGITYASSPTTNYTQFQNIGTAREQGIELDGKLNLGYGFSGSANFTYFAGVMGNTPLGGSIGVNPTSGINLAGDMIPFVPLDMGNLAVSYDHGPYHLTVDERFTGMMNVIDTSTGYQMISPGYFVTDLYATYDLPTVRGWYKSASLYASAYNLFNTNYYNPSGVTGLGTPSIETLFVYPGEPVNLFAGVRFTF